jgi:hypothetical protein
MKGFQVLKIISKFKFKKKSCNVKMNRRERILTTTTENDPFFFLTSDSILFTTNVGGLPSSSDPSNVFSSIFSNVFNNLIEVDRFNEAVQNSMETYNEELFKKVDDHTINLPIVQNIPSSSRVSACFICTAELDPVVADQNPFETTDKKNGFYELPCHHVYHASCLQEAVAHQHYKCCLCQEKIPLVSKACTATTKEEEEYNQSGHRITISSSSYFDCPD